MKLFLIKISLLIFFILLFLGSLELYSRKNDVSYLRVKKDYLENNKNKIECLVLGPSHILRAIDLDLFNYNTLSLAISGSATNVDCYLFNSVKNKITPKFVIINLSEWYIERYRSDEWMRFHKLHYYFGVKYDRFKLKDLFLVNYPVKEYLFSIEDKNAPRVEKHFLEVNYDKEKIKKNFLKKISRKLRNLHPKKEYKKNVALLYDVVRECKKQKIKVIFISPPKYYLYNEAVLSKPTNRRTDFLAPIVDNKTVYFLDYKSFNDTEPRYFTDPHHLNEKGSILFTKELNKRLPDIVDY